MALSQDIATQAAIGGNALTRVSVTDRMRSEREQLKARLDDLDAAIAALEANPELQQILDVVQRVY